MGRVPLWTMLMLCLIDFLVEVQAVGPRDPGQKRVDTENTASGDICMAAKELSGEDIQHGAGAGEAGGWQNFGDHRVSCLIMCVGEDTWYLGAYRGEETDAQQEQMTFASLPFNQFGGFFP